MTSIRCPRFLWADVTDRGATRPGFLREFFILPSGDVARSWRKSRHMTGPKARNTIPNTKKFHKTANFPAFFQRLAVWKGVKRTRRALAF